MEMKKLFDETITSQVQRQFDILKQTDDRKVSVIRDQIKEGKIALAPQAMDFFCRNTKIPRSYFNNSSLLHKVEMIDHYLLKNEDITLRLFQDDMGEVKFMGPAIEFETHEVARKFLEVNDPVKMTGDMMKQGVIRIFFEHEALDAVGFTLGYELEVRALYERGFEMYPLVHEVKCSNGLVDLSRMGDGMRVKPDEVSPEALHYGGSATKAVLDDNKGNFDNMLDAADKIQLSPPDIFPILKRNNISKTLSDKMVEFLDAIDKGETFGDMIPRKFRTLKDLVRMMTFGSQSYVSNTRKGMDKKTFFMLANETKLIPKGV
jgi:hypothetical protein